MTLIERSFGCNTVSKATVAQLSSGEKIHRQVRKQQNSRFPKTFTARLSFQTDILHESKVGMIRKNFLRFRHFKSLTFLFLFDGSRPLHHHHKKRGDTIRIPCSTAGSKSFGWGYSSGFLGRNKIPEKRYCP